MQSLRNHLNPALRGRWGDFVALKARKHRSACSQYQSGLQLLSLGFPELSSDSRVLPHSELVQKAEPRISLKAALLLHEPPPCPACALLPPPRPSPALELPAAAEGSRDGAGCRVSKTQGAAGGGIRPGKPRICG